MCIGVGRLSAGINTESAQRFENRIWIDLSFHFPQLGRRQTYERSRDGYEQRLH